MPSANDTQVGGSHYRDAAKGGEQHWDMMWRLYRESWFVGAVTKYVLRYRAKDGIKDLKKARHYLDKLIELETEDERKRVSEAGRPDGVPAVEVGPADGDAPGGNG